jgi:hypothetical protein
MKTLITFLFILSFSMAAMAQRQDEMGDPNEMKTLVGHNNAVGGYGGLSMGYTRINDRDAFLFSARGAVVMGHMIGIGLAGTGFFNDKHYDALTQTNIHLAGGYGGFFFEPVIMPNYPVHVAFPILIGAGGIGVYSNNHDEWDYDWHSEASDAFMVIKPGVELELNITRFFRFGMGAYYLYTTDVQIDNPDYNVPVGVLRGWSGGVSFKFGKF